MLYILISFNEILIIRFNPPPLGGRGAFYHFSLFSTLMSIEFVFL